MFTLGKMIFWRNILTCKRKSLMGKEKVPHQKKSLTSKGKLSRLKKLSHLKRKEKVSRQKKKPHVKSKSLGEKVNASL